MNFYTSAKAEGDISRLYQGRVAEWFKAAVLKTAVGETPPWVRISPLPPECHSRAFAKILPTIAKPPEYKAFPLREPPPIFIDRRLLPAL